MASQTNTKQNPNKLNESNINLSPNNKDRHKTMYKGKEINTRITINLISMKQTQTPRFCTQFLYLCTHAFSSFLHRVRSCSTFYICKCQTSSSLFYLSRRAYEPEVRVKWRWT